MTGLAMTLPATLAAAKVSAVVQLQLAALAGDCGTLVRRQESPWASITYTGTRYEFELWFDGKAEVAAGEALIAALPEHEFAIAGWLVADATVTRVDHFFSEQERLTVTCVLLLLKDD